MTDKNKKFTNEEATVKIKVLISSFYENAGRDEFTNSELKRMELVEDIDEILLKTDISSKQLIVERLRLDENINEDI